MRIIRLIAFAVVFLPTLQYAQWTSPRQIDPTVTRAQTSPMIAVSKTGITAIVCREGSGSNDSGQLVVYRSTDNGVSFQRGGLLRPNLFDHIIDPAYAIAFDTTGSLWVLWGWDYLPGGLLVGSYLELSKSTDNGISFTTVMRNWRGLIIEPSRMVIDKYNNIHIIRDSVVQPVGPRIIYTRLNNANPSSRFEAQVPTAPTGEQSDDVDFAANGMTIHYTTRHENYSTYEFRIMHSRSLDGGISFSPLLAVDPITPPNQGSPRILARDSLVIIAYNFPDSSSSHLAVVSTDNGVSFGNSFGFGSDAYGLPGRIASDSQYLYLFYPVYDHPFTGRGRTVFNRFTDPLSPPEEITRFDSLFGDLAVGTTGGKYAAFQKQGTASVLFSGKDIPTSVLMWSGTMPNTFSLRAYPNPFNSSSMLSVRIPNRSDITIEIFDLLGRQIQSENHKDLDAGVHQFRFVASELSSGIYFARVIAGIHVTTAKLLCLK